jgi:nitroreductase
MDTIDCIVTKLDVREFSSQKVPSEIKSKVFEAARSTGTGLNTQHWRFILVEDDLEKLAKDSTSGAWVSGANFAVIVLTSPKYKFHMIDAGRVVQNMQLAAWSFGVASGVFTGIREEQLRSDFIIPQDLNPSIIIGFGYPTRKILGKKNRAPLSEIAFLEKYGNNLSPQFFRP